MLHPTTTSHDELPGRPARYWHTEDDGRIVCTLCPRRCRLSDGQPGFCYIRQSHGGELRSLGYGRPVGIAVDPMEKKPLFHFLPGRTILSLGTLGCNLGCRFCQNWDISKARHDATRPTAEVAPVEVVELARRSGCPAIAFTYNDPVIWAEYAIDIARIARPLGIPCVAVTAGYIEPEARRELFDNVDAANVDLKGSERFYAKLCLAHLDPVLDTLKYVRTKTDVWLEITNLLVPGWNDEQADIRRMCEWILGELGADVPLHFTAFHPAYRMTDVERTPLATLRRAREVALELGLHHVYTGNVVDPEGSTTYCPGCTAVLVTRGVTSVGRIDLDLEEGRCPACRHPVRGRWTFRDMALRAISGREDA